MVVFPRRWEPSFISAPPPSLSPAFSLRSPQTNNVMRPPGNEAGYTPLKPQSASRKHLSSSFLQQFTKCGMTHTDTHTPMTSVLKQSQKLLMDHYVLLDLFIHLTKEIRRYGFLFFISDNLIKKSIKTCCMNDTAILRSLCLEIQAVCLVFVKWKARSAGNSLHSGSVCLNSAHRRDRKLL